MNEDDLDKLERMTIRLFLIIILVWVTIMLFKSCSVMLTIGDKNNSVIDTEADAVVDTLNIDTEFNLMKKEKHKN